MKQRDHLNLIERAARLLEEERGPFDPAKRRPSPEILLKPIPVQTGMIFELPPEAIAQALVKIMVQAWIDRADSVTIHYDQGRLTYRIKDKDYDMAPLGCAWTIDLTRFVLSAAGITTDRHEGEIRVNIGEVISGWHVALVITDGEGVLRIRALEPARLAWEA